MHLSLDPDMQRYLDSPYAAPARTESSTTDASCVVTVSNSPYPITVPQFNLLSRLPDVHRHLITFLTGDGDPNA